MNEPLTAALAFILASLTAAILRHYTDGFLKRKNVSAPGPRQRRRRPLTRRMRKNQVRVPESVNRRIGF